MNLFKDEEDEIKVIHPPNFGWLEKKLNQQEMEYLWKCVENKKGSGKKTLAGNIHESYELVDRGDWFFNTTIRKMCMRYGKEFKNLGNFAPINQKHPYFLQNFWVNYQKQGEFNPLHGHNGVYSFVVWMKIPTDYEKQNQNPISLNSNCPRISSFQFHYTSITGHSMEYTYKTNQKSEGTMLFFPANLQHCVYPFFNCDEDRISISGNISINTAKRL